MKQELAKLLNGYFAEVEEYNRSLGEDLSTMNSAQPSLQGFALWLDDGTLVEERSEGIPIEEVEETSTEE